MRATPRETMTEEKPFVTGGRDRVSNGDKEQKDR